MKTGSRDARSSWPEAHSAAWGVQWWGFHRHYLLVLDLAIPATKHSEQQFLDAIGDEWHGYLGYIVTPGSSGPTQQTKKISLLTHRLTPGLGGYALFIVVGLFVPVAAMIGYLVIAFFFVIPVRVRRR
jgi:hypothetical protein